MGTSRRPTQGQLGLAFGEDGELGLPADYSYVASDRPSKQCRTCFRILPDLCFRANGVRGGVVLRPQCVVCEQEIGDAYKRQHRYEIRARNVLNAHKRKERKQGLHDAQTLGEYEVITGVTADWLAQEMRHTYERPGAQCYHCSVPWTEMPNGLSDMSVDRVERARLLSRTNLMLMCRTGNSQKGTKEPRTWDVRQAVFRLVVQERIEGLLRGR